MWTNYLSDGLAAAHFLLHYGDVVVFPDFNNDFGESSVIITHRIAV